MVVQNGQLVTVGISREVSALILTGKLFRLASKA